jgi:hypothetical protein
MPDETLRDAEKRASASYRIAAQQVTFQRDVFHLIPARKEVLLWLGRNPI